MTWPVVVLLLLLFTGLGVLVGRTLIRRWTWPLVVAGFAAAGVLFVPVRCATGDLATPFGADAIVRPTSCEGLAGVVLPELGMFAGDTVGYSLAFAATGLAVWAAALVARPRADEDPQR